MNTATDGDVVGRGLACPRRIRRIRAEERGRRSANENLSRIEIGRFHYGFNRACHREIDGESIAAGGARSPRRCERSLLRRLLDGGVNVEGPSKPDDAQQEHGHQGQHQRGLGDLRPVSTDELMCDAFDVQQTTDPSLRSG